MRAASRTAPGTSSLRSPTRFAYISVTRVLSPVTFAPGRARLATTPCPTGSPTPVMTTGIVPVAFLAARAADVPLVRIRSTFSRTSSAARLGNRSSRPSADRYSMTKLFPSTYPRLPQTLAEGLGVFQIALTEGVVGLELVQAAVEQVARGGREGVVEAHATGHVTVALPWCQEGS